MEVHGEEIFPIQPFRSLAIIFLLKKFYCFLEQDHIDRLKNGKSVRYSPPAKPYNGPTDKVHIGYNSANGY